MYEYKIKPVTNPYTFYCKMFYLLMNIKRLLVVLFTRYIYGVRVYFTLKVQFQAKAL